MLFVNTIAEIVHGLVDQYAGNANKNIGDAFLVVWKIPEKDTFVDQYSWQLMPWMSGSNWIWAEMSLVSFCLILAGIWESWKCDSYWDNEDLNAWMPNYWVSLGFGLHIGWAIEGAIGSTFKIDASYLSPNVNMANILEAATKEYGCPLLFTNDLVDHFSEKIKSEIRILD